MFASGCCSEFVEFISVNHGKQQLLTNVKKKKKLAKFQENLRK